MILFYFILLSLPLTIWAEPLTIQEAFQKVLECSPAISASQKEILVRQAESTQVGLRPNPLLTVAGNRIGAKSKDDSNELFIGLTQLFEMGGKRSARLAVGSAEETVTYWDNSIFIHDIYNRLCHAFIDAAVAQEKLQIASDQLKIAEDCWICMKEKAAGGKISKIEENKAAINFKGTEVYYERIAAQFEIAKKNLAALWGSCCIDFDSVDFPLSDVNVALCEEETAKRLPLTPDFNKFAAEVMRSCERIRLEKANAVPDMTVSAGIIAREEEKDHPFSVAFEIPLPFFDRNQGNRQKASIEYAQAFDRLADFERTTLMKLGALYAAWTASFQEADALKETVLPLAEEAFMLIQESFKEGKAEYLELLDARKFYYETKFQYLEALAECQHKKADIDRLSGEVLWQTN